MGKGRLRWLLWLGRTRESNLRREPFSCAFPLGGGFDAGAVIENRREILPLLSSPGSTLWFCPVRSGMPPSAIFTG